MSDPRIDSLIPDFGDFTPDLPSGPAAKPKTKSSAETLKPVKEPDPVPETDTAGSIADRSRQMALDSLGKALRQYQKNDSPPPPLPPQEHEDPAAIGASVSGDESSEFLRAILELKREGKPHRPAETAAHKQKPAPEPKPAPKPAKPRVTVGEDGIITIQYNPTPENDESTSPAAQTLPMPPSADTPEPGATGESRAEKPASERSPLQADEPDTESSPSWSERLLKPVSYILAIVGAIRAARQADAQLDDFPDADEPPEVSPKKAAKYYSAQARPLRTRCRIAFFLCLILAWISFQLPMAGLLGASLTAQAGVCLVLTLAVMVSALDVFTAGLRQLFDLRPGAESLAAISALLACLDCALVMSGHGSFLPYCAPAAFSMTAALWGQRLSCTALRRTFSTAAGAKNPSVLTSEMRSGRSGPVLMRAPIEGHSIVRRSEQPDLMQTVYRVAAPLLAILSLLLSVLASLGGRGNFLHAFSAFIAVSAALSAFFAFPLSYAISARRLRDTGSAVLGWAGCEELGHKRRILITDDDIFPSGTINFTAINIQEGVFIDKVVSYTASLLAASGSGVAEKFIELVSRRGYSMVEIGSYSCHEGGGLSTVIRDEQILVGSANYMTLMGIHLPSNMEARNSICTAINGELVAVFTMEYTPVTSVQDALVTLLRGRIQGIFAIRDFNITPLMLRHLFRIPTENLSFPSFRERYRMAEAAHTGKTGPASAVIARSGMMPVVEAAETGRRLFNISRIAAVISLIGTLLGLFILFLLFRTGSYDTVSAGNVLSYMLLWALPVVILAMGQNR